MPLKLLAMPLAVLLVGLLLVAVASSPWLGERTNSSASHYHYAVVSQEDLTEADYRAIQSVIQGQLDAFRDDNAELAFSFASASIRQQFGSAENFMTMVKTSYQPVYRPQTVLFRELIFAHGIPIQRVLIIDQKATSVMANYPMTKQPDGSWRINGCYLTKSTEQVI